MSISLRRTLVRRLFLPLVAVLALGTAVVYQLAISRAAVAYDQGLVNLALAVAHNVRVLPSGLTATIDPAAESIIRTDQFDRIYYRVIDPHGRILAGDLEMPPAPRGGPFETPYLYDARIGNSDVRALVLTVTEGGVSFTVEVAETTRKRQRLVSKVLLGLLIPLLLLAGAAAVVVWSGIGRGLDPLRHLRAEISARSHRDLRPLPADQVVEEIRPVIDEMNGLLARLDEAARSQQRFLSNAAHQLRTPLAGLNTQAALARAQVDESAPGDLRQRLEFLELASMRAAHLANRLLSLARAEPSGNAGESQRLDLREVARAAADLWVPRALAHNVDLGFETEPASANGDGLLVQELLANLLDNAITYTPPGGHVTVRTGLRDGHAVLEVEDDGVGIPEAERERVFERFYRIRGCPGEGCGLGLAIVREIANKHQASVGVDSGAHGQGTRVTVTFPDA